MKLNKKVFGKVVIAVLFVLLIVWFLRRTSREGNINNMTSRKAQSAPTGDPTIRNPVNNKNRNI
jgi:hypothetical protein